MAHELEVVSGMLRDQPLDDSNRRVVSILDAEEQLQRSVVVLAAK